MISVKSILTTLAVIFFTALSVYTVQMPIPKTDPEYSTYAYSFLMQISICFMTICTCYFFNVINRLIKSCLIVSFGVFFTLGIKSFFHLSHKHSVYDVDWIMCFVIISLAYLVSKQVSPFIQGIKHLTNQVYMRWQTKHPPKKHKHGSSKN